MLHRPQEAIQIAREVLNAKPQESAPILPAVLLEIVPSAEGQGVDLELAQLLVDAIKKHLSTIVDMSTDPGTMFMQARPFHVKKAKDVAIRLFEATGHHKEALETAAIVVPRVKLSRPMPPGLPIVPTDKTKPMAPVLEGLPAKP
jgi:hypothetical protein